MAELLVGFYVGVGILLALWIGFAGPVKADNAQRLGAISLIAVLWPLFLHHTLRH